MNKPLRVGMYGGAFDPPHLGHVALARAAIEQLQLDRLHIVPTGGAWHKARALTAAHHRGAMAQLAFAELPGATIDMQETQRVGASYTVDTLLALQQTHPGASLYLLIGQDQARAFRRWQRWQDILSIAIICIADRADNTGANVEFDDENPLKDHCVRLELPLLPQSSTDIRSRISQGLGIEHLAPAAVARYIAKHQLYQTTA